MKPLTSLEKDALKEIASIGSNHASTALSKLIKQPVEVSMIHLDEMSIKEVPSLVGGPLIEAVGITFRIFGSIKERIVLLSTKATSLRLAEILLDKEKGSTKKIDMMSRSALKEMGNILVGSYLAALTDFSGINMIASTPVLTTGSADKVVEEAISTYEVVTKYVLVVRTTLTLSSEKFIEDIVLVLKPKSFDMIFKSIVKKIGI